VLPLTKTATWPMCQGMHSPCCAPEPVAGLPRRRLRCPFLRSLGWHYSVCPWGSPWLLWPRAAIWRHLCKSRGSAPFGVWSVTPVCLSLAEAQGEASLRIRRAGSLWIPSSLLFMLGNGRDQQSSAEGPICAGRGGFVPKTWARWASSDCTSRHGMAGGADPLDLTWPVAGCRCRPASGRR